MFPVFRGDEVTLKEGLVGFEIEVVQLLKFSKRKQSSDAIERFQYRVCCSPNHVNAMLYVSNNLVIRVTMVRFESYGTTNPVFATVTQET